MIVHQKKRVQSLIEEIQLVFDMTEDVLNEFQTYYDERSEKWQESERGESFQDLLNDLTDTQDVLETTIENLEGYMED